MQTSHKKKQSQSIDQCPRQIQKRLGQIVVEYVLILFVLVTLAIFITQQVVSRNPDDPGFLIEKWRKILETIGSDD